MKRLLIATLVATLAVPAMALPARNKGGGRTASVTLTWVPPSAREDGSPLAVTEIAGYDIGIVCGADADVIVSVVGGATSEHVATGLPVGDCAFAISSTDTEGLQSDWSDIVNATIKSGSSPKKISLTKR